MIRRFVSREIRYRVRASEPLTVMVERTNQELQTVQAELVDISAGGAKVKVPVKVLVGEPISLRIQVDGLNTPIDVDGKVCWTRLVAGAEWSLGCEFKPRIPVRVLTQLASAGTVERRDSQRASTPLKALANWELDPQQLPVDIVNLSPGGFCLISRQEATPGSRVLLRFTEETNGDLITAKCRWQLRVEEGFAVGCEFATRDGYATFRKMWEQAEQEQKRRSGSFWGRLLGRAR